ncbi:carbohydrate kinase family protein, partial [Rhizobium ruizarguesonis]
EKTTLPVGITHPDGERTSFTTKGHLPHFSLADVFAGIEGARLQGGYARLCGAFLTDDLTADYGASFDWADSHGITV